MIPATNLSYSKEQAKSTTPTAEQPSVFFGYDLPDDITEDEILSFLEEYQQFIVSVEVVLNEKCGNYAKVTFATYSDAKAAMKYYSNQPWYDMGINVTLKPWKDREEFTSSSPKKRIPCKWLHATCVIMCDSVNVTTRSTHMDGHIYIYIHTYTWTHTHTHARTHTCMHIQYMLHISINNLP